MSLRDVFADGYAYREIIERKLSENLNLKGLSSAYSNEEIIDDLQFTLEASAVRFCTKTILFGSGQALYFQIPYKDFGCHNMTIFTEKSDSTTQSNGQLDEVLLAGKQLHTALRPYNRYNFLPYRWMPNSEAIVLSVDSGGGYQLHHVNIDGSETSKLNPSNDAQSQPCVSPDGSSIVYLNGSSRLSIYDLNKHSEVRLPFALPYGKLDSPIVSPDGQMIAYLHVLGGEDSHSDVEQSVHVYDRTGGIGTVDLGPFGFTEWPIGFSPDSTKFYVIGTFDSYNHSRNYSYDMWEVDVATNQNTRLSTNGPILNYLSSSQHPTLPHVVYGEWKAEDVYRTMINFPTDICVVELCPFKTTKITSSGLNAHPVYSPDGESIAYVSATLSAKPQWEVYTVSPDGSDVKQLTSSGHSKVHPQWSPDGKMLSFIQIEGETQVLYVMNADGTNLRALTN